MVAMPSAPARHDRRIALSMRVAERQGSRTEGTFGEHPADDPVGPSAAGAMIDLRLAIDGMIAPDGRIERVSAWAGWTLHWSSPSLQFASSTSDESLGFRDITLFTAFAPCPYRRCSQTGLATLTCV